MTLAGLDRILFDASTDNKIRLELSSRASQIGYRLVLKLVGPIAQLLKYVMQTFICSANSINKLEGTLAGTGRRGRPLATPVAAGSGRPACSSMCSGLMTVAAVSALVERVGWSLQ